MQSAHRAKAAKAFLANPLMRELIREIRQSRLDELAATDLGDRERREACYLTVRALEEMRGLLDVWSKET